MIGVFDSGYGGLNILKSLFRRLPEYDYLYLADNARAPNLKVWQQECPVWAALFEAGEVTGAGPEWFVQRYLHRLFQQCGKLDRVLLACTRYAALFPLIQKHLPEGLDVLTQGELIDERLADWLERHPEFETRLPKTRTRRFSQPTTSFISVSWLTPFWVWK